MADIPWNSEAHLIRSTGGGEQVEAVGVVHQLVSSFLEMGPGQQQGLMLRVTGAEDLVEYDAATIRELAADPGFTGVFGEYDSARDPDEPDQSEAPGGIEMEEGVSGSRLV